MTGHDAVLADLSLEISAADLPRVAQSTSRLPRGARVHVTALATESPADRVATASELVTHGLTPVPHLAARRLTTADELESTVAALAHATAQESLFVIGGDPRTPAGPYSSALEVIESGVLARHGVRQVGIGAYPEGHPNIATDVLWEALAAKADALAAQGISGSIITQVSFDADAVLAWIAAARERGIHLPVRVGVPGPMGVARLLAFARRLGMGSAAVLARKYGAQLGGMLGSAGPDDLLDEVLAGLTPGHGDVSTHLYTFGGLDATLDWLAAR
ncbi:methylenetetrahydrofolate reductase [Demequina litorisediminis]|uniref:Methylenetetrahydrofolate reductase n=1 Tax=Demequina litorisediminis TaxID=1849022 RepID=A0ABQ6IER3_9MICO|nr:methylenetetrahydrofolate reductase [Demequina litorisediminis]GMA35219.1 methylenetetrahydrofolate reductase [Demequina litorisediminis]